MSVGRLVAASTSRFQLHRSGDHKEILLHILSYKQAVGFMEDKPPGYCILRLDPVFIEQHSRSPLYITYKYNGLLLSQALRGPQINVKASKKKGVVICHTDKRHFRYTPSCFSSLLSLCSSLLSCLRSQHNNSHILKMCDFLVRLRAFISEFVSNKNFVEKKIETDADLDKEILYRKFLIYPDSSTRLVVKKKKEDEVETAECGIVFENMSFFSKIGHDIKTIESFNDFLSAFLGVDSSSELECNQLPSQSPDSSLSLRRKSFAPITVNAKEKTRLIETLKGAISGVEEAQGDSLVKRTAAVQKVQDILKEIFESVKVVQLAEEKMDWINRGLLDTLILYREFLGFNDGNKSALALQDKRDVTMIKILKHLVSNNPEGSRALCISMFHEMEITQQGAIQVLEQQTTAYGPSEPGNSSLDSLLSQLATLWEIFSSLIRDYDANPLPWIFVQELGVARLLDVYVQASMQAEKDLKAEEQRRRSLLKKTRQENMSVYRLELPSQTISKMATTQSSHSFSGEKSSQTVPPQQWTNAQHSNSNIPSEVVAFTPEMEQQLSAQRLSVRSAIISGNEQATEDEYLSEMPSTDTSYFSSDDSEDEDSREESEETSDEDRSDDADDSSGTSSDSEGCIVQNNQSKGSPSRPMGQKTKKENPGLPADVPRLLLPTKLSNTPQLRDGPKEHTSSRWSRRIKKSGMLTPHTPVPPPGALTPTSLPPRSASASFIGSMSGGRDAIVAAVNITSSPASSSEQLRTRGHSFYLTARQELSNLATNLGATAVSSDLTALLPYKAGVEEQTTEQSVIARRKRQSQRLTMNLDSLKGGSSISVSRRSATNFQRYSTAFRIKRHAFNILACLASNPKLLYYIRNPANICFTELERMNRMDKLEQDLEFKQLIFSVLRPLAERVELVHRVEWQAVTESLPPERQLAFRRKLDRFLFRVHTALHAALSIHDHRKKVKEVENYLRILADYMEHCPTRVMSSQVLDVCMETVLHVKLMIFGKELTDSNGRFSMRHLRLINLLLRIFGAMACQNRHPPTMAFLLALLVEPMDTISYVKDYAHLLLLNHKARLHIENSESKEALSQYCVTVLKYFNSLLQLLRRCLEDVTRMLEEEKWAQQGKTDMHKAADFAFLKLRANRASAHSPRKRERLAPVEEVLMDEDGEEAALPYNGNDRIASRNPSSLLELRRQRDHSLSLLRRFEFLIRPETGFIAQFLNMIAGVHHHVHYEEEKEFLIFLRTALTIPGNPFVHQKHFIDSIISQHYLRFLKLYNGEGEDNKTLILCQLRLAVLLAFAESKNQKIVLKFFQLKTMDFLVRQVNLEYEIILKKAKYMEERVQIAATKPKGSTIASRTPPAFRSETPLQKSPALHKSSTDLHGNSKSSKRKNPALRLSMPLSLSGLVSAVGGGSSSSSEASRPTSKLAISAAAARKRSNTALSSSSSSATSSVQKATAEVGNQREHVDSEGSSQNSSDEDGSEESIRTGSYDGHSSSDNDYDDDDSDNEDEKPGFSLGIPPLTLTAQVTKDGSSSLPNNGNNETPSIPTLSLGGAGGQSSPNTVADQGKDEGSESDDSTEASSEEDGDDDEESSEESEDDRPKPMIPTLLLTAEHTKDHSSPASFVEAEATTARAEDNNNLNKAEGATSPHTPKQEIAITIPSLVIPSLSLDMSKLGGGSGIVPKTATDDKELNSSRTSPQRVRFTDAAGGETALVEGAQHVPKLKFTEEVLSLISDFKSKDVVEESLENKPEEPLQGLSAIEHRILRRDPSLQFLKKKNGQVLHMNRYKDEAEDYNALTPEDLIERNQLYLTERNDRKIYMSAELHTTCLQLIFSLMLTSIGTLESLYVDQYPLNSKKLNIPYLLHTLSLVHT
ncbi:hypothetical protein QOT17_013152 [Balamuthia mandrillaris]